VCSRHTPRIPKLPTGLRIKHDLIIYDSEVTHLPDDIIIGSYIYACTNDKLIMSPELQTKFVRKHVDSINIIRNPTEKIKMLHNLLWKL